MIRFTLTMCGLLLATSASGLMGQEARTVHVRIAAGGAATGGGGYGDNGGLFGRLGFDFGVKPGWILQPSASFFFRAVNGDCVDLPCRRNDPFPGTLGAITLDAARVISAAPFASHQIALSAGIGPAFVGSSTHVPSGTTLAGEVGGEIILVGGQRAALTFATHALLIPNARGHTLWLVPVTLGGRF